jgi:hypothetical protein
MVMVDAKAKVGRDTVHQSTIGKHSLHERTNGKGLRLVDFTTSRQMAIKSTYFIHKQIHLQTWHSPDGHTFILIDHCFDKNCKKTGRKKRHTPSAKRENKQINSGLTEECAKLNEEKNAARERAIQIKPRGSKNVSRTKERRLFRKKARQLDEEVLFEIERHRSIQDSRKFYKRLNDIRRTLKPQVAMCRAKNGELLTKKNQENFEEHLNEGSESEQPTRPVDLRDDGVDIDLPRLEETEEALKYLKNNKAASADSIAAELLKDGGPRPELARRDQVFFIFPVYKKGDKLDRKNYRGI